MCRAKRRGLKTELWVTPISRGWWAKEKLAKEPEKECH